MVVEDIFRRLRSGKWEGCRLIDVAAEDPEWCKRSASSNAVTNEHRELILKALKVVEETGYTPEHSIDDPRSKSNISRICLECGNLSDSYFSKESHVICINCYVT